MLTFYVQTSFFLRLDHPLSSISGQDRVSPLGIEHMQENNPNDCCYSLEGGGKSTLVLTLVDSGWYNYDLPIFFWWEENIAFKQNQLHQATLIGPQ